MRPSTCSTNCSRAATRFNWPSSSLASSPTRVAFCVPSSMRPNLDWMASIFASISGAREFSSVTRSMKPSSADAIGAELVAQLRSFGVRLVEVDDLLLQPLEIAAALIERHELRIGALGQLVHLLEPGVQRFERFLFLVELVALREQLLVPLRERVDALVELRDVLVFRGERFHAPFGLADRCLQHAQPLIENFEFLLLDRQPVDVAADRFVQRVAVLLDTRNLARELVLGLAWRSRAG